MRGRTLGTGLGALFIGLVLIAGPRQPLCGEAAAKSKAPSGDSAPKPSPGDASHKGKGDGKGKAGDLCDSDKDCAQRPRPLFCRESGGELRCTAPVVHPVVT